jgi:DNA-binding NarL/FixJ family response regulator
MATRVLIVDDHRGFRLAVRRLLEAEGYAVVGEACDGRAALEAARALRPDLVLLDVQLPDLDGFTVAEWLAAEPDAPAVVLTSSRDYAPALTRTCPVRGFVPKADLSGSRLARLLAPQRASVTPAG